MIEPAPSVRPDGAIFSSVAGRFYRAVDSRYRDAVLVGSGVAGRYSASGQPTLYLSSSPAGVAAAMTAHHRDGEPPRVTLAFDVRGGGIADLRSPMLLDRVGIAAGDAAGDWQSPPHPAPFPAPGGCGARSRRLARGADRLLAPGTGLWHLVLFRWNVPDAPTVTACTGHAAVAL